MSKRLAVKNWSTFQHFKDRNPPWIKLHKTIIDDRDINVISDCSFRVLVFCWLLASEDKDKSGKLPDVDTIAFRTRIDKSKIINALQELKNFIVQDDINAISERYQVDAPETETETETETEGERELELSISDKPKNKRRVIKQATAPDWLKQKDGFSDELWQAWLDVRKSKKATATEKAISLTCDRMFERQEMAVEVLKTMIERNWITFKWDWLDRSNQQSSGPSTSFANQKPASYFRGKEQVKLEF